MPLLSFETKLFEINKTVIALLKKNESEKLPSRGMALVTGTINSFQFTTPLEPDGRGSHWLKVTTDMQKEAHLKTGQTIKLELDISSEWPEPKIPSDVLSALKNDEKANKLWNEITPMARWDWLRWIDSTKNVETRAHRIEVACSKLRKGTRRPCCFNRSMCCDVSVSQSGLLTEV